MLLKVSVGFAFEIPVYWDFNKVKSFGEGGWFSGTIRCRRLPVLLPFAK